MPRLWPLAVALLAAWVASACGLSSPDQSSPAPRTGLNDGPAAPPLAHVTQTPGAALEPSLATFRDGFVVAWYDTRDGHSEIYARALSADATPAGPEWRLTSTDHDAFEADVHALGDHDFVIGWYEKTSQAVLVPRMGRWSRDGRQSWVETLAPNGRNTVVRVDGDLVFVAWVQDEDEARAGVWAGWWRASGEVAVPARRVADASRTTWNLNAAVAPGSTPVAPRAWVVFDAKVGSRSDEIFLVEVGSARPVTRLTPDDGVSSKYPDANPAGDRVAITWFDTVDTNEDVYLAVGLASQLLRHDGLSTAKTMRVTSTPGHSIGAYVTWNGPRVGLAWCDDTVGQHEVYVQTFDPSGRPQKRPQRLTETQDGSMIPAIEPWRSGFAMAWTEREAAQTGAHADGRAQIAVRVVP